MVDQDQNGSWGWFHWLKAQQIRPIFRINERNQIGKKINSKCFPKTRHIHLQLLLSIMMTSTLHGIEVTTVMSDELFQTEIVSISEFESTFVYKHDPHIKCYITAHIILSNYHRYPKTVSPPTMSTLEMSTIRTG